MINVGCILYSIDGNQMTKGPNYMLYAIRQTVRQGLLHLGNVRLLALYIYIYISSKITNNELIISISKHLNIVTGYYSVSYISYQSPSTYINHPLFISNVQSLVTNS